MTKLGELIVFEGPDGVGKTTLAKRLNRHLKSIGTTSKYFAFPGNKKNTLGKHVYDFHHNPEKFGVSKVDSTSIQILHLAAQLDAIASQIMPTLKTHSYVILDRYWWSLYVYGVNSGIQADLLNKLVDISNDAWEGVSPSTLFLIDVDKPYKKDRKIAPVLWNSLRETYGHLCMTEAGKYSVKKISNNSNIKGAFKNIVGKLNIEEPKPKLNSGSNFTKPQLTLSYSRKKSATCSSSSSNLPNISPAIPSPAYDTYWKFTVERQRVFVEKVTGNCDFQTEDLIIAKHKFTNCYRASDRVSQYLIKNVIYSGSQKPAEIFFRILLFKTFNKIETWELLLKEFGEITCSEFSFNRYRKPLDKAMGRGQRIYSAAYIMTSGKSRFGYDRKHQNHLKLIELMISDEVYQKIQYAKSMQEVFELLCTYPTIGDFLAFQYAIDINYSTITNFSEMDFVVAGPGAKDGIAKCFLDKGGLNDAEIIKFMADRQEEEFKRLGLDFKNLWGRQLQLIDCQNLFCEVGKYSRIAHPEILGPSGRTRIKQIYKPNHKPIELFYPPKWGINKKIRQGKVAI